MSYLMRHACCCIAVSFLGIAFHRLSSLRFGKYQSELRSQHHQQQAKESIYANNFFDYENPHNVTRRLQGNYYFTATKYHLGELNFGATAGNPYKGLMGSPRYANYNHNANIPSSLEWNYVGLDVVMKGNPDVVGKENAFDWREMEKRLELAASRNKHVVFSMVIHYPGWEKLSVPKYLLDDGLKLYAYPDSTSSQYTPDYGDPLLLTAIEQFIKAFGHQYDGDQRIGFIHLGLLGFWGEWHTFPHEYVPKHACEMVVKSYVESFKTTKLQARYPFAPAYKAGFGLSDGSFTYETLGGEANGGSDYHYYFYNQVMDANQGDFWRKAPMSGETRPENQGMVFKPDYADGTKNRQDFMLCVNKTHASYIFHNNAFDHVYASDELANAIFAHTRMGYNFIVAGVDVAFSTTGAGTVVIDVKVAQIGIAPFYYPLSIILSCPDPLLSWPIVLPGVETLIDEGESKTFRFEGVPATARCLQSVNLRLHSKRTYRNRPIKFAQGTAGTVTFSIPMPPAEKVQEVFSIAYTLFRITNGTSTDAFALTNGTNVDLAQVGKMLSIRADVKLDSEIDVAFTFGKEANYEKTKPFTLMAVQQGKDVAASYLSSVGSKTIRIAVVGTGGTVLTQQVLIFQVVDSSKVR